MDGNFSKGKFIVIEGIDGAGSETQSKLLSNFFLRQRKKVKRLSYPDKKGLFGELIYKFLHGKYNFSLQIQFLLYFADFVKDKEKIKKWLKEGKIIIADRYFTSTLAYQCLRGFPLKEALKIADFFDLPKPDLIIYLEISPKTSIQRKLKEKKKLDRNEIDKKFLTRLTNFYKKLIKRQIFSHWIVINGEESKKKVFEEIKSQLNSFKIN